VTRLYVCGPMSGLPDFNYPAFDGAALRLKHRGYEVENPTENQQDDTSRVPLWQQFMRLGLAQLVRCDGVALLDGWGASRGASLEVFVANQLGLTVMPLSDWLLASSAVTP
jgi:hypothetical protein